MFVTNSGTGSVSVIDPVTNQVKATIAVERFRVRGGECGRQPGVRSVLGV